MVAITMMDDRVIPFLQEKDGGIRKSRMKIAIQGEFGSFSHEAATKLVPDGEIVPCSLSAEVFAALSGGGVEAAVIPIENSLAGSVAGALRPAADPRCAGGAGDAAAHPA
jgi:hypothetical protein